MAYNVIKGNVEFSGPNAGTIEDMVDDHSDQTIAGTKTFSQIVTASLGVSASAYYGDGSNLSGLTPVGIQNYNNSGNNKVLTSVSSTTVRGEDNLLFDGFLLTVTGSVSASSNISASQFYGSAAGLTSVPVDQFASSISAANLSLGNGVENSGGNLVVKLDSNSGLTSSGTGLKLDVNNLTSRSDVLAGLDTFSFYNSSVTATQKVALTDLKTYMQDTLTFTGPAGLNTQVQFNNAGAFGAHSDLTFGSSTLTTVNITASTHVSASNFYGNGSNLTGIYSTSFGSFSSDFNVLSSHDILGISTSGTIVTASLPAAATLSSGQRLVFKDIAGNASGNNIVIEPSGSETIDGFSFLKITTDRGAATIASDGVDKFYILNTKT